MDSHGMEDHFLIEQVLAGNQGAFRFLVIRYERAIFRFLSTFALAQPVIEELAQETFLRAYHKLATYDSAKGASFSSWLFTIARNLAINECARSSNRMEMSAVAPPEDQMPAESPSQEEALSASQLSARLKEAIQSLPQDFRTAVSLSYLQECSLEEIAALERCSLGTVKSRIFRGKCLLRKVLFANMEDPV